MNSEVTTSTFTGTFRSSWFVRLPINVDVACHDLSSVSETVNGESATTSAGVSVLACSAAWVTAPARDAMTQGRRKRGDAMGSFEEMNPDGAGSDVRQREIGRIRDD